MNKIIAATLLTLVLPFTVNAAIALDNSGVSATTAGNSVLAPITTSGSNELIVACSFDTNTNRGNMSATVDGNAMTWIANSQQASTDANQMQMFYYVGATSSAHTITVSTAASGGNLWVLGLSYNGVAQVGQPDNIASTTHDSQPQPDSTTLNIKTDNSWEVMCARAQGTVLAGGTGTKDRITVNQFNSFDSNGPLASGNNTMFINYPLTTLPANIGTMEASFKPFVAVNSSVPNNQAILFQ